MSSITLNSVTVTLPKKSTWRAPSGSVSGMAQNTRLNVLDDINLRIQSGDRVGLIGSNGAGKSTLLRVLGGVIYPRTGSVTSEGKSVCLFSIQLGLQHELSGLENIFLRGILLGQKRREIQNKLSDIIAFSELESVIEQPIYTYSHGMVMRLAFAVSTAFQPEILLLDEWIGAGDEAFQKKVRLRMDELVGNSAITVAASHNRRLLKDVCNKGLWLREGRIVEYGDIDGVLESYAGYLESF